MTFELDSKCEIPNLDIPEDWDWKKKLPGWSVSMLAIKGFPGFDIDASRLDYRFPYEVNVFVYPGARSSRDIAIEFDDIAEGHFDYRDQTPSGLPFGEYYCGIFIFQKKSDYEKFKSLYGGWTVR